MGRKEAQGWNPRLSDHSGLELGGEVVTLISHGRGGSAKDPLCTDGPGVKSQCGGFSVEATLPP